MVPVAFTTFNQYFVKRRVFVMSLAQALIGIIMMLYPIVVDFLMTLYGFRGLVAIIGAISAHTICGMIMMHPIAWHYKRTPIHETEPCKLFNSTIREFPNHLHQKILLFHFSNGGEWQKK